QGFMSVCCLLRPNWIGSNEEEKFLLPCKLVYKFSYSGGLEAVAHQLLGCNLNEEVIYEALRKSNNCEGLFYSLITPSTANWLRVPGPLCYKEIAEDGDVGHLMMEHIEGTSFDCHDHSSIAEVEQIISSIARLQSLSYKEKLDQHKEFKWNPWKTIGTCVLTKAVSRKVVAEIPGFYGAEFEPLIRKMLFSIDEFYDVEAPMRELKQLPPVLVHGDLWQSNLMWDITNDKTRQLKTILDWQSIHVGSPAEDLVFLLICLLSGEDRRTHWRSLLSFHYQSIEREMAPAKPSFSLDDLLGSYIRLFPVLGFIVLMRFSVIYKCSLPSLNDEDRIKFSERMSRKLFLLAEDVVSSFESSRKRQKKHLPLTCAHCRPTSIPKMMHDSSEIFELSCSSWAELEEELRGALNTNARFGPLKCIRRIGENCCFMSVCCLLRPDWIDCTEEDKSLLPSKLVYKFSYSGGLEAVAHQLLGCNLNEEVIYEALRKSNNCEGLFYPLLSPSTANWLHVPGPFCYKEIAEDGEVGHLMMEHIEGTSFDCYDHCSITEVEQIISSIALLQPLSFKEKLDQQKEFKWNPWKTIGTVLTKAVCFPYNRRFFVNAMF
ncbi:hypothetical protein PMAYCL1PPCAC_00796, partial [Pristionchus mayeri]